jgi:hypothetical protein
MLALGRGTLEVAAPRRGWKHPALLRLSLPFPAGFQRGETAGTIGSSLLYSSRLPLRDLDEPPLAVEQHMLPAQPEDRCGKIREGLVTVSLERAERRRESF